MEVNIFRLSCLRSKWVTGSKLEWIPTGGRALSILIVTLTKKLHLCLSLKIFLHTASVIMRARPYHDVRVVVICDHDDEPGGSIANCELPTSKHSLRVANSNLKIMVTDRLPPAS